MVTPQRTSALHIGIFGHEFSNRRDFFPGQKYPHPNSPRIASSRGLSFSKKDSTNVAETGRSKDLTNEGAEHALTLPPKPAQLIEYEAQSLAKW
jgi:hypothetical protein